MLSQVGRDISNAQQRIFDHRVFVTGEINNFLNEFELKRNEAEVETLFKVTETVGDLKYELSDRCISLGTAHLSQLSSEINTLFSVVENFLAEIQVEKKPSEGLIESRKRRETAKSHFNDGWDHKLKRVNNSFEEKEEEISELYSDLQVKLNIPK